MNSREAISTRKWEPPFLTQVSVSFTHLISGNIACLKGYTYVQCAQLYIRILVVYASFEGAHSLLGIDGLGSNDIGDLEIESNVFSARISAYATVRNWPGEMYKLSFVASWTCSSICEVDANHPAIISEKRHRHTCG
jgi:hypothetical protein